MIFPSMLCYYTIGFAVNPVVVRTTDYTASTRQRFMRKSRDDLFSVTLRLNSADFAILDSFILNDINNGADEFTGPYYDSDVKKIGTLQIVDGTYSANLLAKDLWEVGYDFEVKNRDMSNADNIYNLVNDNGGFDNLVPAFNALECLVNFNELNA